MRLAANGCLTVAIIGALLVFAVPGGAWSDVPGYVRFVAGVIGEIVLSISHLLSRSR